MQVQVIGSSRLYQLSRAYIGYKDHLILLL